MAALPLNDEHFGLFQVDLGELRVEWSHYEGYALPQESEAFHLHFNVLKSGASLSSVLGLDEELLRGLVFNNQLEPNEVQLYFTPVTGTHSPEEVLPTPDVEPNPFVNMTRVRFILPEPCEASLRVFDAVGRELWRVYKGRLSSAGDSFGYLCWNIVLRTEYAFREPEHKNDSGKALICSKCWFNRLRNPLYLRF